MAKEKRQIPGKQYFRATFDKSSIDAKGRTVDVVFVTERQVMMYAWDLGLFYEVLPCNDLNADLTRLNNGAPLCDTHDTSTVKNGLGVVEKAWFDNGVGRATVRFSKRADVEDIWQDVQDGIITGVSVGYVVSEYEEIGVKDNLPLVRANKWEGLEISLALVQADVGSGIGRSADQSEKKDVIFIRKNSNNNTMKRAAEIYKLCRAAGLSHDYAIELTDSDMTIEECRSAIQTKAKEKPANPPANTPTPVNEEETRADATRTERTRISEINKAVRTTGLPVEFGQTLIDNATPLDEARSKIIDEHARLHPVSPAPQIGVNPNGDEKDKKQRGMEASIMQRAGVMPKDKVEEAGEFRGMTLMDIAKECLRNANIDFRGQSQMEIATRALRMMGSGRDGGGGLATGDFSFVLANVLNKTLRAMYDLQAKTFTPWTRKSTATDFKQMLRTQLNDIKISKVQEGGEYTYASLSDSGEVYKVAKWGKIVNIDWEAIVNDDMSSFSRIPSFMAGAVAQMQADIIYGIITGSHMMGDGHELFDAANHGNYTTGPGTAISVASLGIGRQLMRDQKSPGGNILNIAPKFLIVGSQNEAAALQFTSQNYVATKGSDINVWAGLLQPIVDARIPAKNWHLVADPSTIDTVEYATLDGQEIFSETRYGFDVDALQYKVRSVFGAKGIEWRSQYKNTGA